MQRPPTEKLRHIIPEMSMKKCAPIEKWAKYREDAHRYFKITPKTLRDIILWAVIVPIGIHHLMKDSQVKMDEACGRKRDYF
mmetsp:Transcript_17778/g.34671  ORF Transcript_17778/g.34671 Transcript_17778/m.34671 type:complete len:82 (+) Transcript_17778:65-310(+)